MHRLNSFDILIRFIEFQIKDKICLQKLLASLYDIICFSSIALSDGHFDNMRGLVILFCGKII